ncbi:MAG: hypothetical protein KC519_23395, partial [Anaerolineae bacterium]|nr:hypothetical protein [Anaerolineae bacterium]
GAWATRLTLPGAIIQTVRQQDDTGLVGVAVRAIDSPDRINWSTAFPSGGLFAKLRNEANGFVGWLYEPFVDGASYAFPAIAGDTPAQQWPDLIPAADWAEHIAPDWQGEEDEITLSVSAGTGFTLNKYDFRVHLEAAIQACLLNGEYRPLTPWCGCTDPKLVDALDEEPDKNKFKALPLQDGMNERCGWLVELTAASEIDNDDTVQATLLLTAGRQVKPFTQEERRFLILNTGWLVIDAGADSQIEIHSGQTVRLSDNVRLDGIAVGPGLHDQSHHLFGLWVPRSEFVDPESGKVGDLRTTRFFPEPEAALLDTPADLLVNIRRNQNSLVERVDILLRSLSLQTEPDFTAADIPPWIVHMLGHDQRALWTLIDRHRSEGRPSHFTREHLLQWCKESELEHCQEDDIERQLELLLSLGLIQRVHVKGDEREGDYYENLFRAVTRGDVMQEVTE